MWIDFCLLAAIIKLLEVSNLLTLKNIVESVIVFVSFRKQNLAKLFKIIGVIDSKYTIMIYTFISVIKQTKINKIYVFEKNLINRRQIVIYFY